MNDMQFWENSHLRVVVRQIFENHSVLLMRAPNIF